MVICAIARIHHLARRQVEQRELRLPTVIAVMKVYNCLCCLCRRKTLIVVGVEQPMFNGPDHVPTGG